MVSKEFLLNVLPPMENKKIIIKNNQVTSDIVNEILYSQKLFEKDYNKIYEYFIEDSFEKTCFLLWNFCRKNLHYKIETEDDQTIKSPAAILCSGGDGVDCKSLSGFIAGVLSAIQRNENKTWNIRYCFASYEIFNSEPEHVFVKASNGKEDFWIDAVLTKFDARYPAPFYFFDKKIKNKMLTRISGIDDGFYPLEIMTPEFKGENELIYYGVLNDGKLDYSRYYKILSHLSGEDAISLKNSMIAFKNKNAIGLDLTGISDIANSASSFTNSLNNLFNAGKQEQIQLGQQKTQVELAALQYAGQKSSSQNNLFLLLGLGAIGVLAIVMMKRK